MKHLVTHTECVIQHTRPQLYQVWNEDAVMSRPITHTQSSIQPIPRDVVMSRPVEIEYSE